MSKNNQPATKEDIKKLDIKVTATQTDLKKTERVLRQEMLRVEERVESLDGKVDKKFDKVMTQLDGIAKGLQDMRDENTVGAHQTRELRVQVDDHEKRITSMESA